ncbi:NADH dehydrogenase [Pelomyxa schiedti]|nr:NADH dehydrogenase [Pelomyxa schiedti]
MDGAGAVSDSFVCVDCGVVIPGTNCAHELSRQQNWRNKPGCYAYCPCGYPVRAKDIRDNVFTPPTMQFLDHDRGATSDAFIYCENNDGGGHVYYGTFAECRVGNGFPAAKMSSVAVFSRYMPNL